MRRLRLILLAVLAAVLAGTVLAYVLNPPVKLPILELGDEGVAQQDGKPRVKGLTYTEVKDGVRKWTLSAEGARIDEAKGTITLKDVYLEFYPEKGGKIILKGDEGIYFQKEKIVTLTGNVRGKTHDGMTLETDKLTYMEKTQLVETDRWVTIAGKRYKVRGLGMTVTVPEDKIEFKSQVDSTFIPAGNGPPPGATAEALPAKK